MDKEATLVPLFGIPVFNSNIESIPEETKTFLKNVELERMFTKNGWYSVDKYVLNRPEAKPLYEVIMAELDFFLREVLRVRNNVRFEMTNSWVVKHDPGDWGQAHVHTNCLLSGVYYLQTNEKSGKIVFRRDTNYTNLFPNAVDIEFDEWLPYNAKNWSFQPRDNQLFFFPSHLLHSIDDNESEEDRYSVAFNFFPRGNLGTKEFELAI